MSTRDTAFFKSGGARTAREQQEFLSKVIGSLGHSFCVIDPKDYRVLLANPASAVEHGAEGVKCYTLVRGRAEPCMGPDLPCPLEEVRRSGKITKVDHVFRKLDGSVAYHEVHVYPFLDEEGKVTRVIEYALNVTDREVAKTALKVAYHNLETRWRSARQSSRL